MKIAVFIDVHGNLKALKAVLGQIRARNADQTIFLGDIFQRGNEETECLELLMNSDVICLRQHRINHNSARMGKEKVSTIQRRHRNMFNYQ